MANASPPDEPSGRDPSGGATTATPAGRTRPRRRVRVRWILLVALVAVVAWAGLVADHLLRADQQLRTGIAAAQRVRQDLGDGGLTDGPAGPDIAAAARDFGTARALVASAWLGPLRILPIVGTQIHAVEDLSAAAHTVTAAGDTTLRTAGSLLHSPHASPAERAGLVTRLAATVASLDTTVERVSLGPGRNLLATIAAKRDTFAKDLATLRTDLTKARAATAALADLLNGPQTYLLFATNNAEMRAGSGMMLQAGTLSTRHGAIRLGHLVPTADLVTTSSSVQATGDLAARWGFEHPTLDFRDLLLSPQFPPNAALAAAMWRERTGVRVDGILTMDVAALQDLLTVTGPVEVEGTTFTAANVSSELLVQQYAGLPLSSTANEVRREKLGQLAADVFGAVEHGHVSLSGLVKAFSDAVGGRHILVWAASPGTERQWLAAGAGGTVDGDDLLLGLLNQGADKLDPYQQVTAHLTVRPERTATVVTVTVTDHNATPAGLTGYAAGGAPGLPPARQYTGTVALDFPRYAGFASATGGPPATSGTDYGAHVLAVRFAVPDGASRTVTFRFTVLGRRGALRVLPSARIPATSWTAAGPGVTLTRFDDADAHTVGW